MILLIKQLFNLLTAKQRRQIIRLQVLVVLMAFAEILAVASIGPFMGLVGNPDLLLGDNILARYYVYTGFSEPYDFMFLLGVVVLLLMATGSLISMITVWKMAEFSAKIGSEIGDRLYQYYLYQPWLFHSAGSSAQLTKQIATETHRVTINILNPLMQLNAKLILVIFIVSGLLVFDPYIAAITFVLFALAYIILYRVVRKRIVTNGKEISKTSTDRYKLMSEAFGGIKDVLLLGRQKEFIRRFNLTGGRLAHAQGLNQALTLAPRYFIELIAFSAVILFVLYLIRNYQGDMGKVLPILAVYSLAGFKLLPSLQQIYASITTIKGGMAAFESIKNDLVHSAADQSFQLIDKSYSSTESILEPKYSIVLKNIYFSYPKKNSSALTNINIEIPANSTIGIVGSSGSGKSTLIDLLLGLISPEQGVMKIDDQVITHDNLRAWQNCVGYVPQNIFLSDNTIKENIAFGLEVSQIDMNRLQRAVEMAHLDELIKELPNGLDTRVGERGVQLSGGQRQRIGIARCLYQEASVLIFDEATSALDGVTEKQIMNAIYEFAGKKTVIMIAHRTKTVEKCDTIYLMKHGSVDDSGKYDELYERNNFFKRLADNA